MASHSSSSSSSSSTKNNLRTAHKAHRAESILALDAVEKKGEEEEPGQQQPFQFQESVCSMQEIVVDSSVAEFAMATPVVMSTTGQKPIKSKKKADASNVTLQYKDVVAHCQKNNSLFRDESFPPPPDDDDDYDEGVVWKRVNGELEEKPLLWGIDSVTGFFSSSSFLSCPLPSPSSPSSPPLLPLPSPSLLFPPFTHPPGKPRKGPSPDDIIQGEVGDCWLLGAMAVLATRPELLKGVFPEKQDWNHGPDAKPHPGVFHFRFFKWGEWLDVLVDDRLPVKKSKLTTKEKGPDSEAFAFARLGPSRAYWPLLLEKAYAKLHGSYACLAGGHSSDAFVDFTGGVCANVRLGPFTEKHQMLTNSNENKSKKKPSPEVAAAVKQAEAALESLWKRLKSAAKSDRLISSSIASGGGGGLRSDFHQSKGLVLGHAYSVLDVRTLKEKGFSGIFSDSLHLLKLRNPWGASEWTGAWSDGDAAWDRVSKSEKKRLDIKDADDGTFWMSFLDFITHFTTVRICRTFNTGFISKWSVQRTMDCWPEGTSGRGPESGVNPQYCLDIESGSDTVEDTDAGGEKKKKDSTVGTRVVIALGQRDPRLTVEAKEEHVSMGLVVHRVQENRKHVQVHSIDYVYKKSDAWINMREVSLEFILQPGRYVIVPSAATPVDMDTEFMLRLYSTGKIALKKLTHNEPPRASKLIGKGKPASAVLSVKIVRASGLTKVGRMRVADPYCTLRLNGKTYATRVQYDTLNPEFGEEFLFWFWGKTPLKGKELKLDVLDKNFVGLDTHLGRLVLPLGEVVKPGKRMGLVLNMQGVVKNQAVQSLLTVELKLMVGLDDILMV